MSNITVSLLLKDLRQHLGQPITEELLDMLYEHWHEMIANFDEGDVEEE